MDNLLKFPSLPVQAAQLLIHGKHLFDKRLFAFAIFFNDHAHIPAGIERIILLFGFFGQLLFMAADEFILQLQTLMQSVKKGIKGIQL